MTKVTLQKIFEKIQQLDEYLSHLKQLRIEIKSEKGTEKPESGQEIVSFVFKRGIISEDFEVFKKEILNLIKKKEVKGI